MTIADIKKQLIACGGNLPGVYKITRKSDNRVYIGQTEKSIIDRIEQHIKNIRVNKNSDSIDRAIQVDGFENFSYEVEVFLPHADTDQLWDLEAQYIAKYDSYNKGFNLTKGNHIGKSIKNTASYIMHTVKVKLFKDKIDKYFNLNIKNKKVLLINYFDTKVLDYLEYKDCIITYIKDSAFVEIDSKGDLKVDSKKYGEYIMTELEKLKGQHFDLIISNPPYGAIGANITKHIVDTINFTEFINLLPANDYQRNTDKDLFKYVEITTMKPVLKGFDDATVTTHIAKINKIPCMYINADQFEIENYTDINLKKYFYDTRARKHYAIDSAKRPQFSTLTTENPNTTALLGIRDMNHLHLSYSKDCDTYLWNVMKSIDINVLKSNICKTSKINNQASHYFITFKSALEKDNFTTFMYSKNGFKFFSKVFKALNTDSMVALSKFMPKVDWTRSWTVEEILEDYGYTKDEIKKVMDDLIHYKDIDRA